MSEISLAEFEAEADAFLDAHAPARARERFVWGQGPDRVGVLDEKTPEQEADELRAAKAWKATEFDAGFGWIVTGEKVWTSGARYSDLGEVITRTSLDKPKHEGLTMLLVDMRAAGVEVRPLRQMTGGASFNEVFLTDVRVPDSHRLGDVDGGWTVALTTLMNERAAIGGGAGAGTMSTSRLVEMARRLGRADDPLVHQKLADVFVRLHVARYTNLRGIARIRTGQLPGPEMSISKLALTQNMARLAQTVGEILGPRLIADTGEWGTYAWSERVLGLPKEPQASR